MNSMSSKRDDSYLAPFGRMINHIWLRWAALILVMASFAMSITH